VKLSLIFRQTSSLAKKDAEQLSRELKKVKIGNDTLQQLNKKLIQERSVSEDNARQLIATYEQLNENKQYLQQQVNVLSSSVDQIRSEKGGMQQRLCDMEELLSTSEAAIQTTERRLTDSKQVLNIPFKDVNLSLKELGSGSFGGVRVGYWCGCPVAVKILHDELAKE
jgi:DNA repair exonuclease SbcCD ATPase subunit